MRVTALFLLAPHNSIKLPTFTTVDILMLIAVIFFFFGIAVFIIYYRKIREQGSSTTFKHPGRWGTIASSGILIIPLLGFLLVGSNFSLSLPSFPSFPSPTPTPTETTFPGQSNRTTPNTQSGLSSDLVTKGTLTVGSDTNYPPQDFTDARGKPTGLDIDLITAMAQKMGLKVVVKQEGYNELVSDLMNHKIDVIISALAVGVISQAEFVPYLKSVESFMVLKNNVSNYNNFTVDDLCGKNVGVLAGSSAIKDLTDTNSSSVTCHTSPISIIQQSDTASIVNLLQTHSLDVAYLDAPVANYYMKQQGKLAIVGGLVPEPVQQGIAVRLGDDLMNQAITDALQAVRQNGTYNHLVHIWSFASESL